jgi:hypothetical protein
LSHRFTVPVAALAVAIFASISISSVARAECSYIPPYPPVTDATRSAREVIVGTVLENVDGQWYDFRLRIDNVLRGPATVGEIRRVRFLYPKWPLDTTTEGDVAPCEAIAALPGDVIALAYGALAPDGATRYNAVSWISGKPQLPAEYQTTTLAAIQALADLPRTDAMTTVRRASRGIAPLLVVAVGLLAGLAAMRVSHRKSPEHARP